MITVVIPTLNEARHIGGLLDQVLGEGGPGLTEVIVADGGSSDETCAIVQAHAERDPRVRLLHNPDRIQSAAVNLAVALADARSDTIVRLDAHAAYPPDFASRAAAILEETGADSVVVRLLSHGRTCFQKAVAAVGNSRVGVGGSVHRLGGVSRWIDHGHHAAFRRESFQRLRGYDRDFVANEDADYDARLQRIGGRIWFTSELEVTYFPRPTPSALGRQYFRYGKGRAQNFRKNGGRLKPRQVAPVALLLALAASLGLAPFTRGFSLGVAGVYFGAVGLTSAVLAFRGRDACLLGAAVALPVMHLAWGAGFALQISRVERFVGRGLRPAVQQGR